MVLACPAPALSCSSWVQIPPALGVGLIALSLPSLACAIPMAGRSTSCLDLHERPIVLHSSAPLDPPLSSTPRAARSTRREPEHGAAPTMYAWGRIGVMDIEIVRGALPAPNRPTLRSRHWRTNGMNAAWCLPRQPADRDGNKTGRASLRLSPPAALPPPDCLHTGACCARPSSWRAGPTHHVSVDTVWQVAPTARSASDGASALSQTPPPRATHQSRQNNLQAGREETPFWGLSQHEA